jgi:anti-anti-sigma factor
VSAPGVSIQTGADGDGGGDVVIARVAGEIDLATAPGVGEEIAAAVPNRALGLVIDLAETTYLDSSGVSLVFEIAERLRRRQQQLCLVVPAEAPLRRVLRIVNVEETVPVLTTVSDATERIRTGTG